MSREWKPGGLVKVAGMLAFYTEGDAGPMFTFRDGSTCNADAVPADPTRCLVVIDPESFDDLERLVAAMLAVDAEHHEGRPCYSTTCHADRLAEALREFANPKPPRPDEPQGLGAVVEDAEGKRWLRDHFAGADNWFWAAPERGGDWTRRSYADINAVRVLSEGVTAP